MITGGFFILICLATFTVVSNSQRAWVGRPLELVFLAYKPPYGKEKNLQQAMFHSVLNLFIINDTQTRIAVVIHEDRTVIVTNLITNTTILDNVHIELRDEIKGPPTRAEDALKLVREKVFADARRNASMAIFLSYYDIPLTWRRGAVEAEATTLRESGIDIFVAARWTKYDNDADVAAINQHVSRITGGDSKRHSYWYEYSSLLKHMRKYYQCHQELCKYVDRERQRCVPDWYDWNCPSSEKPRENLEKVCKRDDCERTCDDAWPWTRETCNSSECGFESTITVNRSEPNSRYDHRWYEHCIPTKPIKCPPCLSTIIAIGASVGAVLIFGVIVATVIIVLRYIRLTMRDMVPDPTMPHGKVMPMPPGLPPPPPPVPPPPPPIPPPPPSVPRPTMPRSRPPIFPVIQGPQGSSVSVKYVKSALPDVRKGERTGVGAKANLLETRHSRSDQPSMKGSSGMNGKKKSTTS